MLTTSPAAVDRLVDQLFKGAPAALVPWPAASRPKHQPPYDRDEVTAVLDGPQALVPVDPRHLRASQPRVTRAGVAYYLSGRYEATGATYADPHSAANRFPLLWVDGRGQRVILTGHHRCAAARLRGEPVWARIAPRPSQVPAHRSVTAALHVARTPEVPVVDPTAAARLVRDLSPAFVVDDLAAEHTMEALGASPTDVARALRFSRTGRLHGTEGGDDHG